MNSSRSYTASELDPSQALLRDHSLTRWMSRDLMQAAADFSKAMGLVPLYAETSSTHLTRYLLLRPPAGAAYEVRSGRDRAKFEEFDRLNRERDLLLLSLHVNENQIYSAVWIAAEHREAASQLLKLYGISAAQSTEVKPSD